MRMASEAGPSWYRGEPEVAPAKLQLMVPFPSCRGRRSELDRLSSALPTLPPRPIVDLWVAHYPWVQKADVTCTCERCHFLMANSRWSFLDGHFLMFLNGHFSHGHCALKVLAECEPCSSFWSSPFFWVSVGSCGNDLFILDALKHVRVPPLNILSWSCCICRWELASELA